MIVCAQPDLAERLDAVCRQARQLWRGEPFAEGADRTRLLLELHSIRFELEDLSRHIQRREPQVDDERRLHECEARLTDITPWWP